MNKWQQMYVDKLYNGKKPRDKHGKQAFELLSKINESFTVHFPDFNGANGFEAAHTNTFTIVDDKDANFTSGKINVEGAGGNLVLWTNRNYQIDYH